MKDRMKRFWGRAAAVVSALSFAISSLAFGVTADAGNDYQMTYISEAVFRALLLQGKGYLDGYYLSTSGVYKPCTFVPRAYYTTWVGSDSVTGIQNELAGAPCLSFGCTDAGDDIATSGSIVFPIFKVMLNLHFGNVKECYFGANFFVGDNSVYWNSPVQNFRPYAYLMAGSNSSGVTYLASNSSGYPNRASVSTYSGQVNNLHSSVLGSFSSSGSDLYISEFNCCCVSGVGEYNISLILPKINNDYLILGSNDPVPTLNVSGTTSGTVTENSSGGFDVNYDFDIDIPDYSLQLDSLIDPGLSPSQSGALSELDDANDAAGQAISDYDEIVDDIDSYEWEIDGDSFALDTIDGDLPDLTPPTDVVDGVNDLWELLELDRSAPIIVRYMPILILFMFGSYVIFGKWI